MDGPKSLEFYAEDLKKRRHLIPPKKKRSVSREMHSFSEYLGELDGAWLEDLQSIQNTLPPMPPETRAVVLIPAHLEEGRIERCLEALARESFELRQKCRNCIEVYILDNVQSEEDFDKTKEVVLRFAEREISRLHIHFIRKRWGKSQKNPVTLSRKLLSDLAILRAYSRANASGPLYLFSEDADVEFVQRGRTAHFIRAMDKNPHIDAIRGMQDRTPSALSGNHLLLLDRRSWYFVENQLAQKKYWPENWPNYNFFWNRVVTGGWNTCFSAEIYSAIGGYTIDVPLFEDMDIGQRISVLRGKWRQGEFLPNMSTVSKAFFRSSSNAARAIFALSRKHHLYDASNNFREFFSGPHVKDIKSGNLDSALGIISDFETMTSSNIWRFEAHLNDLLAEVHRIVQCSDESLHIMSRTLCALGFERSEYDLNIKEVKLLEASRVSDVWIDAKKRIEQVTHR